MSVSRRSVLAALWMTCVAGIVAAPQPQETSSAPVSAKTWVGRQQEIEDYLKRAEVVRMEETKVGVTRPSHAYLRARRTDLRNGLEGAACQRGQEWLPGKLQSGARWLTRWTSC